MSKRAILYITIALLIMSQAFAWTGSFQHRKAITVNHASTADITGYPMLISFTDSDLAAGAQPDGDDIVFTASDGSTLLPYEIERYSDGTLVAWVKTDISSTTDSHIYMYYGDAAAVSQENPLAVWDAHYLAVHHFEETSGNVDDSTVMNYDGSAQNGVNQNVAGIIDGGYGFDGVNDRVQLPQVYSNQNQFTFEAWINSANRQGYAISQRDTSGSGSFLQFYNATNTVQFYVNNVILSQTASQNAWHYVVGSYDGTTARLSVDGAAPVTSAANITWPVQNTYIGDRSAGSRAFQGSLDEIRFSDVARSQGYTTTVYNNRNSPSFITRGAAESNIGNNPLAISKITPADLETDSALNPTLSALITDVDGDAITWSVDLSLDGTWQTIASGTDPDGNVTLNIPTTLITEYETEYDWRITASSGSDEPVEQIYSFRTRGPQNYAPSISNAFPADGATEVEMNPTLRVDIRDIDADPVTWKLEQFVGMSWQQLSNGTEADGSITITKLTATQYATTYTWRVTASDLSGSGQTATEVYTFTTRPSNHIPQITNPAPSNNATDVPLNPTLEVDINDSDHDAVVWSITLNGTPIASGNDADGSVRLAIPTSTVMAYNTLYTWGVIVRDPSGSNQTQTQYFTFRSRLQNYVPEIVTTTPPDGERAVTVNATLVAFVEDKDGDPMNITMSVLEGATWRVIRTYTMVTTGNYTMSYTTLPMTTYQWRVRAIDTSRQTIEETMNFTTGGALALKWSKNLGSKSVEIMPVMGDVDNDGTQEIVTCAGSALYLIDGKNGNTQLLANDCYEKAVELADLNNDGTPEILYGVAGPRIKALNGDGSIRWSTLVTGDGMSMFPIAAVDIDGDGYPTIYFATEDTMPWPYSGNPADYDGAVTMLDHTGKILGSTWLEHPCWGGIAVGDANYDGEFEIYVSDRRYGYGNVPGQGVQAFDAHTLKPLWSHPEWQHSSPVPILADVVGNRDLELIATPITFKGPTVVNATSGATIFDYTNRSLPTHGVATVYDIDQDGHMEIIMGSSYPETVPPEFAVFDLITGETEFRPVLENQVAWPPKVGDVNNDGKMEILVGVGPQGTTAAYPLLIYDQHYNLIDRVDLGRAGQIMPVRMYDTDSDGLFEAVVPAAGGGVFVYDVKTVVPNPAPRTWEQMYSSYRQGAPIYIPLPGPDFPTIRNATPADGSMGADLHPTLSIWAADFQKDPFSITFELNDGSGWTTIQTYTNRNAGFYTASTVGRAEQPDRDYLWRVTTNDGKGHTHQKTFKFTTRAGSGGSGGLAGWQYRKTVTVNRARVSGTQTSFPVLIMVNDSDLLSRAQSDGDDIVFTASDGLTRLPHEIERYQSGRLVAWVKMDISSAADTQVYMYYGNSGVGSQATPAQVWDANYLAVHHLEETSGSAQDSTANNNDGVPQNGVTQTATGRIDGAYSFDGSNDRVQLPQVYSGQTRFTFEGWFNSNAKQGYSVSQRSAAGSGVAIQYYPSGQYYKLFVNGANAKLNVTSGWHYVVGVYDGSKARIYIDGSTRTASAATNLSWPGEALYFGDRSSSGQAYSGLMDEIRLSGVARSASWIATSYNNQNSPTTFVTLGSQQPVGSGNGTSTYGVISISPTDAATGVAFGSSQISFNLTGPGIMNFTVTTTPDAGGSSRTNVPAGRYTVPVELVNFKNYTWQITYGAGSAMTTRTYRFSTAKDLVLIKDSDFDASTGSSDLRLDGIGQDWYESRLDPQGGEIVTLATGTVGGNAGKKAALRSYGVNGTAILTQELSQPEANMNVSFDIYIDRIENNASKRTGQIYIGTDVDNSGGPNSGAYDRFAYLAFYDVTPGTTGNDLEIRAYTNTTQSSRDASTWLPVASGLSYDTWYNVRIVLSGSQKRYSVYLNDALVAANIPRQEVYYPTTVSHVSFSTETWGGDFYVDNIQSPAGTAGSFAMSAARTSSFVEEQPGVETPETLNTTVVENASAPNTTFEAPANATDVIVVNETLTNTTIVVTPVNTTVEAPANGTIGSVVNGTELPTNTTETTPVNGTSV
jgi:hypothetical protein